MIGQKLRPVSRKMWQFLNMNIEVTSRYDVMGDVIIMEIDDLHNIFL